MSYLSVHFYLVRHGQTQLNRSRHLQGITNSSLTPKGIRMAERLGRELSDIKFTAVYTSDLKRTQDTAEHIIHNNQYGTPPLYCEPNLRELSFGQFEETKSVHLMWHAVKNLGMKQLIKAFLNEEHVLEMTELFRTLPANEQIESFDHLVNRITQTLRFIGDHTPDESNVLIVTHGLILSSFIESLEGEVPLFLLDNSRASLVNYQDGEFEVEYINRIKLRKEREE
ncbi:phosphoglycerate mutase [Ligilactobacillus ceti DSM 22408]|uniref:Phosphoglycerate mutase n=1 Tax=Ligilactobacillus ceti DSM 22408 TaxID=1122146 RepID=A0A0R2KIK6_9LACO|nr:phosphoglycerate mutase [Ligilactobacillus ceti DSM 22408]